MHAHHGGELAGWAQALLVVLFAGLAAVHLRWAFRVGKPAEAVLSSGIHAGMNAGMVSMVLPWAQPGLVLTGWTFAFAWAAGWSLAVQVGLPETAPRPRTRDPVGAAAMGYMINPIGTSRVVDVALCGWFAVEAATAVRRTLGGGDHRRSWREPRLAGIAHALMAAGMAAMFAVTPSRA